MPAKEKVSKATRTRIVNLIKKGRVKFAGDVSLLSRDPKRTRADRDRDFNNPELVYVKISHGWARWRKKGFNGSNGGLCIRWGAKRIGFGELNLSVTHNGKTKIDSEHMPKAFVKAVLCHLVDNIQVYE